MRSAFRNAHDKIVESKIISNNMKVAIGLSGVIGLAAWKVVGNNKDKRGQTLVSQEKPDVLMGPQRDLDVERAKMTQALKKDQDSVQ